MYDTMDTMTHDERLKHYKHLIDQDIADYSQILLRETENKFGDYSQDALEPFVSILSRGGKRLRGALVMASYEMFRGTDQKMIIQAARAIEMIHAYVLMIDDIADHSPIRRGGPAAHMIMQKYHADHELGGDNVHFGESMAAQAAMIGGYLAEQIIDDLDAPAAIKLAVLKNLHANLVRTGHGQLRDILNEALPSVGEDDALWVAKYKTSFYTLINPLEVGGLLAGASDSDLEILRTYGLYAGIGFQIADDIMGIFGDSDATGKSSLDDLKEGKMTILMTHALAAADENQQKILKTALGNPNITEKDVKACQDIIKKTGALEYATQKAEDLARQAKTSLGDVPVLWQPELVGFLRQLTATLINRKT
jgi:geranylgeranyl diphosphate synthase type I